MKRFTLSAVALLATASPALAQEYDVLIRGGTVYDGSGAPGRRADVAIRDDRIVAVGTIPATATAKTMVDARGRIVAPGFIDPHSHAAPNIQTPELAAALPMLHQGITTLFLTPYLVALAPRVAAGIMRRLRAMKLIAPISVREAADAPPLKGHLIIIGFGPAGQAVGQTLEGVADRVAVIDLNPGLIRKAKELGFAGHIGDSTHADVLEHIDLASAAAAVVTVPDPTAARGIVELIR